MWIDGSALAASQVGYFNLTCELVRSLVAREFVVHVATDTAGRAAIGSRLNGAGSRILFEPLSWQRCAPRGRAPAANATEIVIWRGSFRWRDTRHIAMVQDLTTRIHPELHTAGNVAEFEEFLHYVHHHAHAIVTISDASRRDILSHLPVCPGSVAVLPMPIHPQYVEPQVDAEVVRALGIPTPYVLCVGTIEPRKNLRRLVQAFQQLRPDATRAHTLVLAGPIGWDDTFGEFLRAIEAPWICLPGYVPLESLPSLYHFASAVMYPSVYEGFGLPVLEAMCCSAIVAGSNRSSVPEVLGAGALQFDPYDVDDIARALRAALTLDPAASAGYRLRNRRRALAHVERLRAEPPLPGLAPSPLVVA